MTIQGVNEIQNMSEEIKVAIRMRPLNERETNPSFVKHASGVRCWRVLEEHNAITQTLNDGITPSPENIPGKTIFTFDKVFSEKVHTKKVYEDVGRDIVYDALEGRNCSLFAYGQTSSGKTHTMQGSSIRSITQCKGDGENEGFLHYAAIDLFNEISERENERTFKIHTSVIEVYNEEVKDLLFNPNDETKKNSQTLKIREDPKKGIFVTAIKKEASSLPKFLRILSEGEKNRMVAKTTLNQRSSRSHLIFCIMIESKPRDNGEGNNHTNMAEASGIAQISTLNLVDLAGSESVKHRSSHSNEQRRKEGGNINKSLLTLSRVISALGQPDTAANPRHIGYRDSKLTRVLQPSLSGNAKLAFVCCVTASGLYLEETKSTLQFAQRIKHVKTASKINLRKEDKSEIIKRLQDELNESNESLLETLDRIRQLENENKSLKFSVDVLTSDRTRALEKIQLLEKEKKVIDQGESSSSRQRKVNPVVTPEKEKPRSLIKGSLAHTSSGIIQSTNNDLINQVGLLSTVVEQLQGRDSSKRKEEAEMNGMPSSIAEDGNKSVASEVTEPTRYGNHVDEG